MREQKEIDQMIAAVKRQRAAIPQMNYFGDDNWEVIDAQLEILASPNLHDEDDLYEQYDEDVASNIRIIFDWLDGAVEHDEIVDDEHWQ